MAKGKKHIKQRDFSDRNFSSLDSHQKLGNKLASPFSKIPGPVSFVSWRDTCIPNILWACILVSELPRDEYLDLFRKIVASAREGIKAYENTFVTHNHLAVLTEEDFSTFFKPVLSDEKLKRILSPLLLLETLPDIKHWRANLPPIEDEYAGDRLARAVLVCLDHQSQESTDIRWLKILHLLAIGKVRFPREMSEIVEEYLEYPNKGDMRKVRPSIRALEIGMRNLEFGLSDDGKKVKREDIAPKYNEFWAECYAKTECILGDRQYDYQFDPNEIIDEITKLSIEIGNHFDETNETTAIDVRHDGAFGLTIYGLHVLLEAVRAKNNFLVSGRILLRTIVELFITLHYLTAKDDETIWAQYRSYGLGQAKLSFLKNVREEDVPEFIDLKRLEDLANEDMWLEFQDINLGSWAKTNLRQMATDSDCKEVYDKFYDLLSGYAHGHWGCVRDVAFTTCLNPLHRLHRIPAPMPPMPSVINDACKLVNRMLDDLNQLYPGFKLRLRVYKTKESK